MVAAARVLTLLAAVVAAVLVAQPSTGFDWPAYRGAWAIGPTLFTANLTAVVALLLAALISVRRHVAAGARSIAGALACGAAAWGLYSGDFDTVTPVREALLTIGKPLLLVVASGFLVAFGARFPRSVSPTEIALVVPDSTALATPGDPWYHMGVPLERLSQTLILRPVEAIMRLFGFVPSQERRARAEDFLTHHPSIVAMRIAFWSAVVNPLPIFALLSAIAVAAALRGWSGTVTIVYMASIVMVVMGAMAMRVSYRNGDADERRRAMWVMVGFAGGYMIVLATMLSSFVVVIAAGLTDTSVLVSIAGPGGPGIWYLSWAVAALFVVLCLATAIFRHGALDPGLALRRTVAASIIGVLLATLLATLEAFVSEFLTDRLALPASTGAIASGVVAALVFGPLWKRITAWVDQSVLARANQSDDPAAANQP